MFDNIKLVRSDLKKTKPLILCLTNFVTMDFMANALLAIGAAPIMSREPEEFEELIKISHAVNINIGTLDMPFIDKSKKMITLAQRYKKPIILDPVGAGASLIRTNTARELMHSVNIIRGNASEITALADNVYETRGVESTMEVQKTKDIAHQLAQKLQSTIVVSGKDDFITDGNNQELLNYGSSVMPFVTGMGCALSAVIAAFHAMRSDAFEAACFATAYFGLCGECAEKKIKGPGTFRTVFIDNLARMDL